MMYKAKASYCYDETFINVSVEGGNTILSTASAAASAAHTTFAPPDGHH